MLARVRDGETLAVTNHGEVTAVLVPPHLPLIDQLRAAARVRAPALLAPLGPAKRVRSELPTADVLDGLRGER